MKTKVILLGILSIFVYSCESKSEFDEDLKLLDLLVKEKYNRINNYMYYDKLDDSLTCHPYIPQLKENSNTVSALINNGTNFNKELDSFLEIVDKIVTDYSSIGYEEIEKIDLKGISGKQLLLFKLKLIEYITLESIVSTYQTTAFNVDKVQVQVHSEKNKVEIGEEYKALLYMITDNTYRPYIAVVDGDTLPYEKHGAILTPVFKHTPKTNGKKSFKGKLYMEHWGKYLEHSFEISFNVK